VKRTVVIKEPAFAFLCRLAPEPRRSLKRAFEKLRDEQGDIRPQEGTLSGYYRLRVGRYRAIFSYPQCGEIEVVFVEERALVVMKPGTTNL
jgi:mRNA interferase RelE/StbE